MTADEFLRRAIDAHWLPLFIENDRGFLERIERVLERRMVGAYLAVGGTDAQRLFDMS